MNGHGAIVIRITPSGAADNGRAYHEHDSISVAKREAHRIAMQPLAEGSKVVVYVPVAIIERTPPTQETVPNIAQADGDLPF